MLQPSQVTETPQKGKAASEDKAITRLQWWCLFKQGLFICTSTFRTQRWADPPTTRPFTSSALAPSTWGSVVLVLGVVPPSIDWAWFLLKGWLQSVLERQEPWEPLDPLQGLLVARKVLRNEVEKWLNCEPKAGCLPVHPLGSGP